MIVMIVIEYLMCSLTSSAPAHKPQVIKSSHLILHDPRSVTKLSRVVLVVSCHHCYNCPVGDLPKGHHLQRERPLMRRKKSPNANGTKSEENAT